MQASSLRGSTIALLASGGLDSCTIIRWLTDQEIKVVAMTADLGQPDESDISEVTKRVMAAGAVDSVIVDAKEPLVEAGLKLIQTQSCYEGQYWNTTGIARHVTVQAVLPQLKKRGIRVISHGATGRGNDQVRFQVACNMLAPQLVVYAPWRDGEFLAKFRGRREMIEFCHSRGVPVSATLDKPYSTDANLLGLTHEAGKLESLATSCSFITPGMGVHPKDAPLKGELVTVRFDQGRPVAINGEPCSLVQAFERANEIGGRNGVGIGIHLVENRFVGIKSRGVYESPGMELLGSCYALLLQLVLDRRAREVFDWVAKLVAKQIYQGYGFDCATKMLFSAVSPTLPLVTGTVTVEVCRGLVRFERLTDAPCSLYCEETASMEAVGDYDHADSEGFLRILGVGARMAAAAGQVDPTNLKAHTPDCPSP